MGNTTQTAALQNSTCVSEHLYPNQVCFIGEVTRSMIEAAEFYNLTIVTSDTGTEFKHDEETLLVFKTFETEACENILQSNLKGRMMGAPALIDASKNNLELPLQALPLVSLSMRGIVVSFTGFKDKSLLIELVSMINCMGGSVSEDIGCTVTHLIACKTSGLKYDYAKAFEVPVMAIKWVFKCWNRRYTLGIHATDDDLMVFRQKPFIDCAAAFLGFSPKEKSNLMITFAVYGGKITTPSDPNCTHLITDNAKAISDMKSPSRRCLVNSEWLWTSVQENIRVDEKFHTIPTRFNETANSKRKVTRNTQTPNFARSA